MELYEKFLQVNPRKSKNILKFICDNCTHAVLSIDFLSRVSVDEIVKADSTVTAEIQDKVINNITLKDLKRDIKKAKIGNICSGCNLCYRMEFEKKQHSLKEILETLGRKGNPLMLEKLNDILEKYLDIKLKINQNHDGGYFVVQEFKNLYQEIIFNMVKDYANELSNDISRLDTSEFFLQIARILISTKKFMDDIRDIRDKYLDKKSWGEGFQDYVRKDNVNHEAINNAIEDVREKYLLSRRWTPWLHSVVHYDVRRNHSSTYENLPDGSVYFENRVTATNNGFKRIIEPEIVRDERKDIIDSFNIEYNQNINIDTGKKRWKPFGKNEFEKYLRWYDLREKGNTYIDIYDIDKESYPQEWSGLERYKESEAERKAINRISKGIQDLRKRVYKIYK